MVESSTKKRRFLIITSDEKIIDEIQNYTGISAIKSWLIDDNEDNQSSSSTTTTATATTNSKKKKASLTCVVCGSPATGYNFDAITCESCKAFFRRNALKTSDQLECRRQGQCDVSIESRRRCSACRLRKCFLSGMRSDRLLNAEQKAQRQAKIEENRRLTNQKQQPDNPLPTNSPNDQNLLLLTNLSDLLPASSIASTVTNNEEQRTVLSNEDLQRVENIQSSYEQRIEIAARDGLPWNPEVHANTFLQHLNSRSVSVMRLISFFKQIPEFNELNVSDRVTLVKYNLMPLTILNSTLSFRSDTQRIQEIETDAPWDPTVFSHLHEQDLFLEARKIFESFVRLAQYDQRIIQLALIILILTKGFSTSGSDQEPILNDEIAVYRAQNHYTELLWKYLEASHGRQTGIKIFSDLVAHFISWLKLQRCIQGDVQRVLTSTDTNDLLPIMKSLLHIP